MTSIHILNVTSQWTQFKCNYLRKRNISLNFLKRFSKSRLSFEHFEKKDEPHGLYIDKIAHSKDVVRQISKTSHLRTPYEKRHGKWSETLLKSARQHLYDSYWLMWRQLSCKKSLLVICKILWLFINRFYCWWQVFSL